MFNRRSIASVFAMLVTLVASGAALGCSIPPGVALVPWEQLVDRSPRIALARLDGFYDAEAAWPTLTFQTLEVLRGDVGPSFSIDDLCCIGHGEDIELFNHHHPAFWPSWRSWPSVPFVEYFLYDLEVWLILQDPPLWPPYPGSGFITPSCDVAYPLEMDSVYLVFLDEPRHVKSFEHIDGSLDAWLSAVRARIKKGSG